MQPSQETKYAADKNGADDDLLDGDGDSQDELDDQAQEELAEIHQQLEDSHIYGGHVAESGVIERVELINFMCHKRLTVPLGPQINFIIGHNGSGKSAVLTGITVALGGKAASTSRANSLKSFVREGSEAAQVTLWIKNKGPEAFKHDQYGDRIIVERKINADGGGHWRMKNHTGKTISSKREELNAFCDHSNIQVDNPMNVLTQDAARQFLSSSNAGEMYDFFLKGTQLKQLSDEYELIKANVARIKRIVEKKEEALPDLENAAREAAGRYQLIEKQRDQQQKLQSLKNQVVWAQVVEKEDKLKKSQEKTSRLQSKAAKIEKDMERLANERKEIKDKITGHEARVNAGGDRIQPWTDERLKLREEVKELKSKLSGIQKEEDDVNSQYNRLRSQADDLQRRIDEETAKLAEDNQAKHQQLEAKHREILDSRRGFEEEEAAAKDGIQTNEPLSKQLQSDEARALQKRDSLRNDLVSAETVVQRLTATSKNSIEAFGQGVVSLVQSINRDGRWHKKPVGPIGSHVTLKDAKWAPVLESVLGNTLNAFCVVDHHDRRLLEELKRRHGCATVPIITAADELFDFSSGESGAGIVTILRVINVDNEYVLRQLVNAAHIEAAALVERRPDGDVLMRSSPKNVRNCFSADMFRITGGQIGSGTSTLIPHKGPPRLSSDVQEKLEEAKKAHQDIQRQLQAANEDVKRINTNRRQVEATLKDLRVKLTMAKSKAGKATDALNTLEEDMRDDEPGNMGALEAARKETREELDQSKEKFAALQTQKEEVQDQIRPKIARIDELKQLIDEATDQAGGVRHALQKAMEEHVTIQNTEKARKTTLRDTKETLEALEKEEEDMRLDVESATSQAMEYTDGERVEATRSHEHYEREIEAVEKLIEEARRRGGGSVEEVVASWKSRQKAYDDAKGEMDAMQSTIKAMSAAISSRLAMWQRFRQSISLRARSSFTYHLNTRGYSGSLAFNHDAQKLHIRVQTEDAQGRRPGTQRSKDPRSLSGGEKSFSTICLLLSLWEAIGCPIRCLDEFDVFMDAVNRKLAMKMMIDTAKTSYNVQYVLITPQNMANTKFGPEVSTDET